MYTVDEILQNGLQSFMATIEIYTHTTEEIEKIIAILPKSLNPCPYTFQVHNVRVELSEGVAKTFYKFLSTDESEYPFDVRLKQAKKKLKYSKGWLPFLVI